MRRSTSFVVRVRARRSSSTKIAASAVGDLEALLAHVSDESGGARAESLRLDLLVALRRIAGSPRIGHAREDLTGRPVLFRPVHGLLVVDRPTASPVESLRALHGARDPAQLREAVEG
jgi:plasmid stabilization system protein ParE